MDYPTCSTCPYWLYDLDGSDPAAPRPDFDSLDTSPDVDTHGGECRRSAPVARMKMPAMNFFADRLRWPRTTSSEWCGEHPDFPAYIASRRRPGGGGV